MSEERRVPRLGEITRMETRTWDVHFLQSANRQSLILYFFARKARTKNLNGGFHVVSPISANPSETFIGVRHASCSIILQSLRFANRMPFIKNFLVRVQNQSIESGLGMESA
jgi:hypothetical protein